MSYASRRFVAAGTAVLTGLAGLTLAPPAAQGTARGAAQGPPALGKIGADRYNIKTPTSTGFGGAVSSVDPEASRIGIRVLRRGGNAVDAAVATAAALGVTEPYSAGIGGGGYFVHYNARTGKVSTLDGRETAPISMPDDAFIDQTNGQPLPFATAVTSGLSVGTPGTLATWRSALRKWGTTSLRRALRPAARLADRGFVVDSTFNKQTADNQARFANFPATSELFLPGGQPPVVGSIFRNPDLADTYRLIGRRGIGAFYGGPLARQISETVKNPPKASDATLPVPPGYLETSDLARYRVLAQVPTRIRYRGYDVYGMAPSSSGGSTVGEALNILERFRLRGMSDVDALHHYLEASALAFADRARYVGDPAFVDVPLADLLSNRFAAERACEIDPDAAATKPVAAGDVASYDGVCNTATASGDVAEDTENLHTTNLTASDRWGNVVEYTLTIEQTGGSGITVPGRGFLLNNELTDFSFIPLQTDPNSVEGGKRPRSSMSPTIVLRNGRPFLALGSPGGSTIITTVLQMLFNRIDRGMTIEESIAAPRASQRNFAPTAPAIETVTAEQAFIAAPHTAGLIALGHVFNPAGPPGSSAAEIGAATAIEFGPRGRLIAVSEPVRRGGGSALVVRPD